MVNILKELERYFKTTPREKIVTDWEECSSAYKNSIEVEKYLEYLNNFKPKVEFYNFNSQYELNETMVYFLSC